MIQGHGKSSSILHAACLNCDVDRVRALLDEGVGVDALDLQGNSPLMVVLMSRGKRVDDVVRLLMESGASLEARDPNGRTPLHHAAELGLAIDSAILPLMLSKGANPNARENHGWTPLHLACHQASSSLNALHLLDAGADLEARGHRGMTPLHLAASTAHNQVVIDLIEQDADVNATDDDQKTPVRCALAEGLRETVSILIAHGACTKNLNGINMEFHQMPALHAAAMIGLNKAVKKLLQNGNDPNQRHMGKNAMDLAIAFDQPETLAMLQAWQANEAIKAAIVSLPFSKLHDR